MTRHSQASRLLDPDDLVEHAEGLDEQLLEQVLRLGFGAGQAPCEPVQSVEMRPHDAFEDECLAADLPWRRRGIAAERVSHKETIRYLANVHQSSPDTCSKTYSNVRVLNAMS